MELATIEISKINIGEQPRTNFEKKAITELSKAIKANGFNGAIHVRKSDLTLIAGERRVRASIEAGLKEIPALLFEMENDDKDLFMSQLAENENRVDLSLTETLKAYEKAITLGTTESELAKLLGKSVATVKQEMSWLTLPKKVITAVDGKLFPKAGLPKLMKFPANKIEKAFDKAVKGENLKGISGILKNYAENLATPSTSDKTTTNKEKKSKKLDNKKQKQAWEVVNRKINAFKKLPKAYGKNEISLLNEEIKNCKKILEGIEIECSERIAQLG